jgi:hypothetical protein
LKKRRSRRGADAAPIGPAHDQRRLVRSAPLRAARARVTPALAGRTGHAASTAARSGAARRQFGGRAPGPRGPASASRSRRVSRGVASAGPGERASPRGGDERSSVEPRMPIGTGRPKPVPHWSRAAVSAAGASPAFLARLVVGRLRSSWRCHRPPAKVRADSAGRGASGGGSSGGGGGVILVGCVGGGGGGGGDCGVKMPWQSSRTFGRREGDYGGYEQTRQLFPQAEVQCSIRLGLEPLSSPLLSSPLLSSPLHSTPPPLDPRPGARQLS